MKTSVTLAVEDNILRLDAVFLTSEEANAVYDSIVACFEAGKDAIIKIQNPEATH